MATMPAASPSRPSMRFNALARSTTHTTVSSAERSGESRTTSRNGMRRTTRATPVSDRTLPASTMPATLAGAETGRTSSITPTTQITTAAETTPSISVGAANTSEKSPTIHAARMPASSPPNIAVPPRDGVGAVWTFRSSGATTSPEPMANRRTIGVAAAVAKAATAPTIKWGTTPGTGSGFLTGHPAGRSLLGRGPNRLRRRRGSEHRGR